MASNTNIQFSTLDFNDITTNFIAFLQSQNVLKDYNYTGSALRTLVDVLAYNTQYNAFYLNMVGNEMFLDSAIQRSSVVSQAKLLNYTPTSAIAPTATINMNVYNVLDSTLTLPQYTRFLSNAIDGVNYTFLTVDATTVTVSSNTAVFSNVEIKQAVTGSYSYTVDTVGNPTTTFEIADANIDLSTLQVTVQQSSSNAYTTVYSPATDFLNLTGESTVYFTQEGPKGNYQIYFGDGVLGRALSSGQIVNVSYLSTNGTAAAGANSFTLLDTINGYGTVTVYPLIPATNGSDKESIASIKFQAPKSYSAQNRAVTKNDYITAIQQNNLGITFDAVNVWGGEQNNPPVYGQVFISLKPTGAYNLTSTQKSQLITQVIDPISVVTVTPTIVDPDYTYIKLNLNVYYNPTITNLSAAQIQSAVIAGVQNFATSTLNTFNSTFNAYDLLSAIQGVDASIITSEYNLFLQKKFIPNFSTSQSYNLYYNSPLARGTFTSATSSSPAMQFTNPINPTQIIDGVFLEEIPQSTFGVSSITITNSGFNYQTAPTVTIIGDGSGATATASIDTTGRLNTITVTSSGNNYTFASATITPAAYDTTGTNGAATVTLNGRYGTLRLYYLNSAGVKTILNSNIGVIDYSNGIITLNSFNPLAVDNQFGQLSVQATPTTSIVSSTFNRILTLDLNDPSAISVNIIAKTNS